MLCVGLVLLLLQACNESGPEITGCVVDVANKRFDCIKYPKTHLTMTLLEGVGMVCISPDDFEDFLKACEKKQVLPVPECELNPSLISFTCKETDGETSQMSLAAGDNYFCVSLIDKQRMIQRCSND